MTEAGNAELLPLVPSPTVVDPLAEAEQKHWRATRDELGRHRRQPAAAAEVLYPDYRIPGLVGTAAIAASGWIPDRPIPLSDVRLALDESGSAAAVAGAERESAQVRPLTSADQRYARYSHAVRNLAAPRLFENRLCFRLLAVDWARPQLDCGMMGFFDAVDTNEAVAHEMAAQHLVRDQHGSTVVARPSWRRRPFRKLIGDPFDLDRRPLMGGIGTPTIRAGETKHGVAPARRSRVGWRQHVAPAARGNRPAIQRDSRSAGS